MSYYKKHIFICTNQKELGKTCCAQSGGDSFFVYMKQKLAVLNLQGPNAFRLSKSGCLGRCKEGPVMVIYPEGIWYTYENFVDIDEIISTHLLKEGRVNRLIIQ